MECWVWRPRVLSHSALHGEGGPCSFRRDASEAPYALLLLGMPVGVSTDPVTREWSSAPSSHHPWQGVSLSRSFRQPREWRGPLPRRWIPIRARSVVHAPQFVEKSHKSEITRGRLLGGQGRLLPYLARPTPVGNPRDMRTGPAVLLSLAARSPRGGAKAQIGAVSSCSLLLGSVGRTDLLGSSEPAGRSGSGFAGMSRSRVRQVSTFQCGDLGNLAS